MGEHPNCANTFSCGTGKMPVKAKERAGCPPHKKLFLQKWDAPFPFSLKSVLHSTDQRRLAACESGARQ
jgi:hypothetical protein